MNMSISADDIRSAGTSLVLNTRNVTNTTAWLPNFSAVTSVTNTLKSEPNLSINHMNSFENTVKRIAVQSTTEFAQNLQDIATKTIGILNNSGPEVTISKPEVKSDGASIGTAEKVVIGAAVIVLCLAIVALILRLLGPYCRSKNRPEEKDAEKIFSTDILIPKLSFTNLGTDISSESTGTGNSSSPDCSLSTDWSELSTERAKSSTIESRSSSEDPDENMSGKHYSKSGSSQPGHGRYSTHSLPTVYRSDDRFSSKGSPALHRKYTDEQMSIVSTQSLEPLRLEQQYRDRWDDQFDPSGSLPRGNLSYHSHPSESRLSLSSMSSGSSHQTFPIPSKEFVKQMHMDKERRYPSNTPAVKKEKHVRLSPPNR